MIFISGVIFSADSTIIIKNINTFPEQEHIVQKESSLNLTRNYSRKCKKSDILGFWKVEKWTPFFHIPAKDWNKSAFMKFQWYEFSEDNVIKSFATQKKISSTEVKEQI